MNSDITFIPRQKGMVDKIKDYKNEMLRVAAYCRVSTNSEEQQTSYEAQVSYYTNLIHTNPNWSCVGIFTDEGKSGANITKRTGFLGMMESAENGEIDLILMKSVSRFARNNVDFQRCIERLKELGVGVVFDQGSLNTLDKKNDLSLNIMSLMAEEDLKILSESVKFGKRQKFSEGRVIISKQSIGLNQDRDGNITIVPEEAEIVKNIYSKCLVGCSLSKIARELEIAGHLSPSGNEKWYPSTVKSILKNEKYKGDALLQKTFVADFKTKKVKKNTGQLDQYYVEGSHPAIISPEIWDKVQEELAMRTSIRRTSVRNDRTESGKYSGKYQLSRILVCDECGKPFRRAKWTAYKPIREVWRCLNRLERGKTSCEHSPTIDEYKIHNAILKVLSSMLEDKDDFISHMKNNIMTVVDKDREYVDIDKLNKRINNIDEEMMKFLLLEQELGGDDYRAKIQSLKSERAGIKAKIERDIKIKKSLESATGRVAVMIDTLRDYNFKIDEFNQNIVRTLIKTIRVRRDSTLLIEFYTGVEIECEVE